MKRSDIVALLLTICLILSIVGVVYYPSLEQYFLITRAGAQQSTSTNTSQAVVAGRDLPDALLLLNSAQAQPSDVTFRNLVKFYGLTLAEVNLNKTALTDALLRDPTGAYFPTVEIAGANLDQALDINELNVLNHAIQNGASLFISTYQAEHSEAITKLSNGEIGGSTSVSDHRTTYHISELWPDLTREMTGLSVQQDSAQVDFALNLAPSARHSHAVINAIGASGNLYPLFVRSGQGKGQVYVCSDSLDQYPKSQSLAHIYAASLEADGTYKAQRFSHIVPMMMFIRATAGSEVWHANHHYANFTLDDPSLRVLSFNFAGMLREAIAHNFHVTIAMPPMVFSKSEAPIIDMFAKHPDQLSLVQHGNNHDDYEFYRYSVSKGDQYKARPLAGQEANIVEGRTRMEAHTRNTGLPYGQVMIFPFNISPLDTLTLLKQYNFQATINSLDVPIDQQPLDSPMAFMYPAELGYAAFPVMQRGHPNQVPAPFELFLDRPVLLYEHREFFQFVNALDPFADTINGLHGKVEWQSLDYILKHLMLERTEDDGTIAVMMFGNDLIIDNESATTHVYHVRRTEDFATRIAAVTADGQPLATTRNGNVLQMDLTIPPGSSQELRVRYAPPDRDFAIGQGDVSFAEATGTITTTVHNSGTHAGPVTVGYFNGDPDKPGTLLGLATAQRVEPHAAAVVTATLSLRLPAPITVAADPYNVIEETNEQNNSVIIGP